MEMFVLGLAVGGLVGAGGKRVIKPIAKGYMAVADKAKEWSANVREDLRDTIEEARYERERSALGLLADGRLKGRPRPPAGSACPTHSRDQAPS